MRSTRFLVSLTITAVLTATSANVFATKVGQIKDNNIDGKLVHGPLKELDLTPSDKFYVEEKSKYCYDKRVDEKLLRVCP